MAQKIPLSLWVKKGDFIFVSGITWWDTETGEMPPSIAEQTHNTLLKIKSALTEAGATMKDVVKVTVFIREHQDYDKMNEVYRTFFDAPYPARTTVEASPRRSNANIEIDAVAYVGI